MPTNDDLLAAAAAGIKTELDGGFMYYFTGSVPASADDALDMVSDHTQVAMLSVDNDGATGLTFETPTDGVLNKTTSEAWSGTVAFDGTEDAESTLTPTFFRLCQSGDNGRGAGAAPRVQGTLGGPSSTADIKLASATVTANGTNTVSLPIYYIQIPGA